MLAAALLAAAATFVHPNPQPPADLPLAVYQARRARVMQELHGCVAVLSAQTHTRDSDEGRPDPDFFWLTGIDEPGAAVVLAPGSKYSKTSLFLQPRDPEAERWTGMREALSPGLKAKLGFDVIRRGKPDYALLHAAQGAECVAILGQPRLREDPDTELAQKVAATLGLRAVQKRDVLVRLRQAHTPDEIARMERAIAATRAGHEAAARATVAGVSERDVQTQMELEFFRNGATGLSYGTIVGSGENGAILHWRNNSRLLRDGDLVVVDAAAEYGHYAADVTRTYPVNGRFSPEQAKVYRAVYQAQEDIFAALRPGASMEELQHAAEESLRRSGYLEHFIHGFGHFVGLEVHDVGRPDQPLPVGAILTVEPGVYLPERGFGVRIEDQVLVTDKGYRLLTSEFPRKLEDVEAWVAKARRAP